MKIHYLQHVPYEELGYIEIWLKTQKHEISSTKFFEKDPKLPLLNNFDALIIMGGVMGVNDEREYPWLVAEKEFISTCIQKGKKVLGICLGAQLIANCMQFEVKKATNKEIGWFPVFVNNENTSDFDFVDLFKGNPTVFHWHGDQFDLKSGGSLVNLLSSKANSNQGFYYDQRIIGLQFHLEVTQESIHKMLQNGKTDLVHSEFVQSREEIEKNAINISKCNEIMAKILSLWLKV